MEALGQKIPVGYCQHFQGIVKGKKGANVSDNIIIHFIWEIF